MKRINYILNMLCAIILICTHLPLKAQTPMPPQIDTPLTVTQDYFFNAPLIVPHASGEVGIFNNAEVEIFSSTEVTLLPGFTASTDSGCGEFVAGIRDCPVILIEAQVKHVSCYGKPDGKIRLICSGGNEPYLFNWSPINKITQTLSGLIPGTYSVTVTDQSGCTVTDTITILEPPPMAVQVNTTPSECNESSGSATVIPSGGAGNYKYFWEQDGYNLAERAELSAGLYEILVQDSNNCSVNAKASISDIDGPEASVEILTGVSCHGYNDASARIILPSSYGPEPVFPCGTPHDRLPAGTHPVMQQDSNGCITMIDLVISEPEPLTITVTKSLPECGENNGNILTQVSGGTAPYSFIWDNAVSDSINLNLYSGVYALKVSDANGCYIEQKIFLPDTNSFTVDIVATDVTCNKSEDGSIVVTPTGGESPYVYRWFAGDYEIGSNNHLLEPLSSGRYSVFISDDNNCASYDSASISYPDDFDVRVDVIYPMNDSSRDGSITLDIHGAMPPYFIEWSNQQNLRTINNLNSGVYTYQITDQNNCILDGFVDLLDISLQMSQVPCPANPNQTFNYAVIMASCTTCNPQVQLNPVFNLVDDFGAIPNDNISDQESFEWASDFIRQNYCTSGVKLIIPPGNYIVGRQDNLPDTYLKGFSPLQFCDCENVIIEGQIDPVTGEKPTISFDNCLKYGAFDPQTGLRYIRHRGVPLGNVHDYKYAADPGNIIQLFNCKNFEIKNLELDGRIHSFIIGGYFATDLAGINLPHGGVWISNSSNITIENVDAHHFGLDGLLIRDVKIAGHVDQITDMNIRLLTSTFNNNSRIGFHWNGGNGVFASKCEFNYNGFGPWGGTKIRGGLEMEVDGWEFKDLANGYFARCDFMFNNGASIISNAQQTIFNNKYYNFHFKKCNIVSAADGYSTYIENKNVTFECCNIVGQVMSAYDAAGTPLELNLNTKFIACEFNEEYYDPITMSLRSFAFENHGDCTAGKIGNASRMLRLEGNGIGRVLFDGCTFNASRYSNFGYFNGRGGLGNINNITIRNSVFIKRNGDGRDPNNELEIFDDYNRMLMWLISVQAITKNKVFIPHSDSNCFCIENGAHSVKPYCWFVNACTIHYTTSTLKGPRAYWGGYCDFGPSGSGTHCLNFEPDGYTDAGYTDPINLPCILKYENPTFTHANINIMPPAWTPGGEIAPLYWLYPLQNACIVNLRQHEEKEEIHNYPKMSISPVPAKDLIQISNAVIGENVYIYNTLGKTVYSGKVLSPDYLIDIGHLKPGVYYLMAEYSREVLEMVKIEN